MRGNGSGMIPGSSEPFRRLKPEDHPALGPLDRPAASMMPAAASFDLIHISKIRMPACGRNPSIVKPVDYEAVASRFSEPAEVDPDAALRQNVELSAQKKRIKRREAHLSRHPEPRRNRRRNIKGSFAIPRSQHGPIQDIPPDREWSCSAGSGSQSGRSSANPDPG